MNKLQQLLTEDYQVASQDLDKALRYQSKYGGQLEHILINLGSFAEDKLTELYCQLFSLPRLVLADWLEAPLPEMDEQTLERFRRSHWALLAHDGETMQIAACYPLDVQGNDYLQQQQVKAAFFIADESEVQTLNSRFAEHFNGQEGHDDQLTDEEEKLRELASEAPTVNLLNSLISRGLRQGASDMHLEPYQGRYRVRYRIDGVLHEVETLPRRMQLPIVTRLKILSGMDIAERRRPQDGKIAMRIANQDLDIRVSALPLNEGESMVMRFLRQESIRYDMAALGLASDTQQHLLHDITRTAGVILLTGPTGSGKTTTLYSCLNELNQEGVKIITLEDPVEYQLEGINQVQVNSDIGFDFAAGLRSIVRQDPDIIMLGEIRDKETAHIAMQSALTGHLVFSTVHTNDAASAYTRLLDLGVDEFLLNAALISIVAQRLARKLCPHCHQPHPQAESLIKQYDLTALAERYQLNIDLRQSVGCEACGHTGYKGRVALNEYFRCDENILKMDKDASFLANARQYSQDVGLRNLLQDGFYKAILGQTTIDEVIRVAG